MPRHATTTVRKPVRTRRGGRSHSFQTIRPPVARARSKPSDERSVARPGRGRSAHDAFASRARRVIRHNVGVIRRPKMLDRHRLPGAAWSPFSWPLPAAAGRERGVGARLRGQPEAGPQRQHHRLRPDLAGPGAGPLPGEALRAHQGGRLRLRSHQPAPVPAHGRGERLRPEAVLARDPRLGGEGRPGQPPRRHPRHARVPRDGRGPRRPEGGVARLLEAGRAALQGRARRRRLRAAERALRQADPGALERLPEGGARGRPRHEPHACGDRRRAGAGTRSTACRRSSCRRTTGT